MNDSRDVTLCIFAKAPRSGRVKTRLATSIGADAAARLAQAFLDDTLALARKLTHARLVLVLAGSATAASLEDGSLRIWPQGEGDLGERMERALHRALTETSRVLALGTDSPGMPQTLIEEALQSLDTHDAVLGPSDDGGFYLLGLRACPPGLLFGLPWSAAETCARTSDRLRDRGLRVGTLPGWFDVDTVRDLMRLEQMLDREEVSAPATRRVLTELRRGEGR